MESTKLKFIFLFSSLFRETAFPYKLWILATVGDRRKNGEKATNTKKAFRSFDKEENKNRLSKQFHRAVVSSSGVCARITENISTSNSSSVGH